MGEHEECHDYSFVDVSIKPTLTGKVNIIGQDIMYFFRTRGIVTKKLRRLFSCSAYICSKFTRVCQGLHKRKTSKTTKHYNRCRVRGLFCKLVKPV